MSAGDTYLRARARLRLRRIVMQEVDRLRAGDDFDKVLADEMAKQFKTATRLWYPADIIDS